jgi:hypothetical protein
MTARLAEARECSRGRKVAADRRTALDQRAEFDTSTIELTWWMHGHRLTWSGARYNKPAKVRNW